MKVKFNDLTKNLATIHYKELSNQEIESALNEVVQSPAFRDVISLIYSRFPFAQTVAKRFYFMIIDDSQAFSFYEPDYCCVFTRSRVCNLMSSAENLLAQFNHILIHEWCRITWTKITTPKDKFTGIQRDVLEEIYGQRLIHHYARVTYLMFPNDLVKYFELVLPKGGRDVSYPIYQALTFGCQTIKIDDQYLGALALLYSLNPENVRTFDWFTSTFLSLLNQPNISLRKDLDRCYDALGHAIEWS